MARLGDHIFKPEYGYTTSAIEKLIGPKFLRITDIQDSNVDWVRVPYCECDEDTRKNYLLKSGDIVVARIGATTGKAYLIHDCPEAIFASYLIRIQTKPDLLPEFLKFYCESDSYWRQINQQKAGRLKGGVNIPVLQNMVLPLPSLSEQGAIARALRLVQGAKEVRQREVTLEHERKAALMQHLFTHGTHGEPVKQTEIGEIPESWQLVKVGQRAGLITKGSSPNWQGFEYCDEGIVFVRSQNVGLGRLELTDIAYLPEEFNRKEKKSIIRRDDLLINIVGASIGRAAVATKFVEGGNLNQAVAIVRLKQGCKSNFVMNFLLVEAGQSQIHKKKKDIARANLSLQDIANLLIPLPPLSEQDEISDVLSACDTKIAALEQEKALLDELFRALLEELMTGRLSAVPLIDSGNNL